jgi:uncharacterized delta-60 repeat protein
MNQKGILGAVGLCFLWVGVCFTQDILWIKRHDTGYDDMPYGLAVDKTGNIFVTGRTGIINYIVGNGLTVKYSPAGDTLWTRQFDYGSNDEATGVAVDNTGSILVTGDSFNPIDSTWGYITFKYLPNGDTVWTRRFGGFDAAFGRHVAVDPSNNVIVTGQIHAPESNYMTVKYSPAGDTIWTREYDSGGDDWGLAVTSDPAGNVIVTGKIGGQWSNWSIRTIKYGPLGNTIWTVDFDSLANNAPWDIGVDDKGFIIMTGTAYSMTDSARSLILKYSSAGKLVWARTFNGDGKKNGGLRLVIDSTGNIFVGGYICKSSWDFLIIKYTPDGDLVWSKTYDSGAEDAAYGIAIDPSGNLIAAGCTFNGKNYDYLTIKYNGATGTTEMKNKIGSSWNLSCVSNPADRFTIKYSLPEGLNNVRLDIYDIQGRLLKNLVNESQSGSAHTVQWDGRNGTGNRISSGIYLFRLAVGSFTETKKIVMVR